MKNPQYGFGLVGCGLISSFHAKAIKHSDRMNLIAVTDLDSERANKISKEFGCEVQFFEKMLEDQRIDIINILTPNAQHFDLFINAADAKKHILVEKPPEMSIEKVDKMINAAKVNNIKAGVIL